MPYIRIPGIVGKVYVPEKEPDSQKKHPCKDCFHCQWCSDDRCHLCLRGKNGECGKEFKKGDDKNKG